MQELEEFRDMVQQFLSKEVAPHYETWEAQRLMPKSFWTVLGQAGLLLVDFSSEQGGAEADFEVSQLIQEEMCRGGFHGLASGYNIHANIVAPYIANIGTAEQQQKWLPRMASGEVVTALGMTEPSAGSDLAALRSRAVRDGSDYILNGSKVFITNGIHADMVVVAAKTNPDLGSKGVSLFLVDASLPGFSRGKKIEKMGQHSSDTAELFFSDIRLPSDTLLGEEGKGFVHMMQELPRERLGVAIQAIGHAQGAVDLAVDYVNQRTAFGQSIAKFQNTRFKMAEMLTEIELCRALYEKYLDKFKREEMSVEDAAMLKFAASEMQLRVVNDCLQLFGGYGYTDEYPISRFYRDARVQTIYAGSTEIMKEIIARPALGR
jgi:alkylation response protein AidB-like acyl-CoA dehydrogenase